MKDDLIFVGFPTKFDRYHKLNIPPIVDAWLTENNIKINYGYRDGREIGFFLDGDLAIIFKLKFAT